MPEATAERWHRRTAQRVRHSLRWRLVLMFLLLAAAMASIFVGGMQRAIGHAWRAAALPLVADYVDRLVADLGSPPSVERARLLVQRLPLTLRIEGPQVRWDSHPGDRDATWQARRHRRKDDLEAGLLVRQTADGHRVELGLGGLAWDKHPRFIGLATLAALLLLTAGAYAYVHRLLRPLQDIRAGAQRFGRGEFDQPIPLRRRDELGDLAQGVNTMAADIHQMLEAKRALLLAISHELRSPLTRARLHAELLPEDDALRSMREPLLRDLRLMGELIADLLESERLASPHAALQMEALDLPGLVRDAMAAVPADPATGAVPDISLQVEPGLPDTLQLDPARLRLLLRNLFDNALRHGGGTRLDITLAPAAGGVRLRVRDHGPGVDPAVLSRLAEPFYRPDNARQRSTGGVGLGLYLCRLIVQAHGGTLSLHNASPGLAVEMFLPG